MALEIKHLENSDYFVIIASSWHPLLLIECCKLTGRSTVEVDIENERVNVVCSHQSFDRLGQRNVFLDHV